MRLSVLLAAMCAGSCVDEAKEASPLPLDEPLSSGKARAGIITKPSELVGGDTAKGGVGDYKLYNSRIAVIIAAPGLGRGLLPYGGNIIDADRVRPKGEPGQSSYGEVIVGLDLAVMRPHRVIVAADGRDGGPAILRVEGKADGIPLFDALLGNVLSGARPTLEFGVEYTLDPDVDFIRIKYLAKNVAADKVTAEIGLPIVGFLFSHARPFLPGYGFVSPDSGAAGPYFAAFDEGVSYLYFRPEVPLSIIYSDAGTAVIGGLGDPIRIRAQETISIEHLLLVGDGDVARTQGLYAKLRGEPVGARISGKVTAAGTAIPGAKVNFLEANPRNPERNFVSQTRTDADGAYQAELPPGEYHVVIASEGHPVSEPKAFTLTSQGSATVDVDVAPAATISYEIKDERGGLLPAKLTIVPEGQPVDRLPPRYGSDDEPSGVQKTEYAITGRGSVSVRPGSYSLWVSRGAEYEVATSSVTLVAGARHAATFSLQRVVDTSGWIATDTHIHAQLSSDSPDRYPFKVKAMVVEGLELPISTEHEAIGDFNPAIEALGLQPFIKGIVGSEVSTTTYGHINGFPLVADPTKPGNGRIEWIGLAPAKTFEAIRANPGDPYVQVNHPRSTAIKGYFTAMGFNRETFLARRTDFSDEFDGIEVANGCSTGHLNDEMLDWFAFLNHGKRRWATGSTDSHRAGEGEMGFPRTYVKMPTDDPRAASLDDFRRATKAGQMSISCGPFLDMKIGSVGIGGLAQLTGRRVSIEARVSAPSWIDVDTLEVILNGEVVESVSMAGRDQVDRFRGAVQLDVPEGDAWVILRARGDEPHRVWPRGKPSWAFTNPIFLDGNGDGAWSMP
ncbi:MAG: CehA/McbA family metallohydrolase [Deltaproteobacteria bacterium]|nr:CehA/McbA family metallohydrolase [Deltaproteobacteria bacterium]